MDVNGVLGVLSNAPPNDSTQSAELRQKAHHILTESSTSKSESLPTTLLDLLTQIIKPLFTSAKHPALTSTGRKNLVPPGPSLGNRFDHPLTDDDLKPWKTPFTVTLLRYIIQTYPTILPVEARKQTLEAHFHLLIPPILNMIDDGDPSFKVSGCQLLRLLCEALLSVESEMLRKTGLGDVFFDALKANFMLLPTLTPEEDSLAVLTELYPAFLAAVDARYYYRSDGGSRTKDQTQGGREAISAKEFTGRQDRLKQLLRHGVLASLSHLSSGQSFSSSTSVPLTTYLVSQIKPIVTRMGIDSVRYLREFLPMLRGALADPFALAAPELVVEILQVLAVVLHVCEPRVRDRWWPEVLRGLVACWVNCLDDLAVERSERKNSGVKDIQARLTELTRALGLVVEKEEWQATKKRLLSEEEDLTGLLES